MIVWCEQEPDFRRKSIEGLVARLPFTTACAVMLGEGELPKVVASRPVLDAVWAYLAEHPGEMGGLLIGSVHALDSEGDQFVVAVADHVQSVDYDSTGVSLRMDTGVWERARLKAGDTRSVIGWYHSHPNLGAFFSGTDRRTQSAFFNHPHCLGLVVDPVRKEEKWFIGRNSDELDTRQVLRHG